ncbi:MAG: rhodanese-like domain-containing protein, partial [Gammaproteobacteria bacterium]
VREQSEFEVSHLKGAIQIDPDISRQEFNQLYGDAVSDKTVVFYCSVGRRSSLLADRLSEDLSAWGTKDIYNLRHGIFGWHNNYGELVDQNTNTDYVHPYNWLWGRLLERRDMLRYDTE